MTDGCCCGPKPTTGLRKRDESIDGDRRAAGTTTVELSIGGLSCGGCARSVEAILARIAGVERADIAFGDSAASRGTVRFDPARVTAAEVLAAIEGAGYQAAIARA